MCIRDRYNLTESIVIGASLLEPYMPGTAEKNAVQLNTSLRSFEECTTFGGYISGSKVTEKPEILFARLDAVSYTHLDVYKRQEHTGSGACAYLESYVWWGGRGARGHLGTRLR